APSKLFLDVVDARLCIDLHYVLGFAAFNAAFDLLAGRNHKSVITTRSNSGSVLVAGDGRAQQRADVAIGPVDVDRRMVGRGIDFLEWRALHRAIGGKECE